jgi:hypothetical protein
LLDDSRVGCVGEKGKQKTRQVFVPEILPIFTLSAPQAWQHHWQFCQIAGPRRLKAYAETRAPRGKFRGAIGGRPACLANR